MDNYPSETMRVELSEKLGLSDRQLQMWFCHRRLKDKKDLPSKKPPRKVLAEPLPDSPRDDPRLGLELANEYGSGSGSGSSPYARVEPLNVAPLGVPGYYESPQAKLEHRAIACVEAQLGEPLRENGPILGVEFDPLPPDAFGAPIGIYTIIETCDPYLNLLTECCCFFYIICSVLHFLGPNLTWHA